MNGSKNEPAHEDFLVNRGRFVKILFVAAVPLLLGTLVSGTVPSFTNVYQMIRSHWVAGSALGAAWVPLVDGGSAERLTFFLQDGSGCRGGPGMSRGRS